MMNVVPSSYYGIDRIAAVVALVSSFCTQFPSRLWPEHAPEDDAAFLLVTILA